MACKIGSKAVIEWAPSSGRTSSEEQQESGVIGSAQKILHVLQTTYLPPLASLLNPFAHLSIHSRLSEEFSINPLIDSFQEGILVPAQTPFLKRNSFWQSAIIIGGLIIVATRIF